MVDKWQDHAGDRRPTAGDLYYKLSDEKSQEFMLKVPFGDGKTGGRCRKLMEELVMKARYFLMCAATAIVCLSGAAADAGISVDGSISTEARVRDNSWTTGVHEKYGVSEIELQSALTTRTLFEAEGTGFEPATGFPASDFESDR